jgi:hypothetical protein
MLIPVVPGALIATAALKGPEPVRAAGFAVTCIEPGKLPALGVTVSQLPPLLVTALAVKELTLELLLESMTEFVCGTVLFAENVKLNEFGFADMELGPGEFTSSSTRTATKPPPPLMFRKPLSVARVESAGLTLTVSWSGVVPLVGVTVSQLLLEKAEMVSGVAPTEEVMVTVCDVGVVPAVALNVSCGGVAVKVAFCAFATPEKPTRTSNKLARHNTGILAHFMNPPQEDESI